MASNIVQPPDDLDRDKLQREIHELYNREHAELGDDGTLRMLEKAEDYKLASTLSAGGVLVFPHAGVHDCGHQIAGCVHAALDSGADRVVVISVLHAFTSAMEQARRGVSAGNLASEYEFWGIQGPGLDFREEWKGDHALISWRHFWDAETKRRGINGPEMIERYPYLAGGKPEELPNMAELQDLCKDAVIVSTADPFHHGLGYGTPAADCLPPDETGIAAAHASISEGISLLEQNDMWGYNQQCVRAKSDARDAGQVFTYLRGPMKGRIVDITISDSAELYGSPPPTWVAGALIEWKPA